MVFKNPVKPVKIELVPKGTPCGFSKSRHKKMAKKKQITKITEEDFTNIGYGLGRMIRVFKDGFDRGINESLDISKMDKTPFNQSEFEFEKKLRNAYYPPNFIRNSLEYKEWLKMNLEKGGDEDDIHQAESENCKSC